jgi:hypothetical protein
MAIADDLEILTCNRPWVPPAGDPLAGVVRDCEIRSSIAHSIGELDSPPPDAVAALIYATLNDEDSVVATAALDALVRVAHPPISLPVAIAATFRNDESVRECALEHVAALDNATANTIAARLQTDRDEGVVRIANMIVDGTWWAAKKVS